MAAIANGQLGSGSTDYLLNARYNVRLAKFGISSTAGYKINSANKDQYKFGDKITASSFAYYAFKLANLGISPNIGVLYEHTEASELQAGKIDLTGGTILNGSAGLELAFKKIAVGFNVQFPLAQNFAQGQTRENIKGMLHLSFAF